MENPGSLIPLPLLNIAFSQQGLNALGIKDDIGDAAFSKGQLADAQTLGDQGTTTNRGFDPHWEPAFKNRIDGVLLAAGESWNTVDLVVKTALDTLGQSVTVVYSLKGAVRPGDQEFPRVPPIEPVVPEFHDFLDKNPIVLPGLDPKLGSELMGARLVGRWKSGAPIQLAPLADDPELAKDKQRNNNFSYPQATGEAGQTACPYAAHIRKTNPRNDLDASDETNTDPENPVTGLSIMRAGIPYGPEPEVTPSEQLEKLTEHERGLAFVSYQSALLIGSDSQGFRFIQQSWANKVNFPPNKGFPPGKGPGFDPIVGQANGASRATLGTQSGPQLTLPQDFVVSRGGEYFFSPSILALKTVFAGVTP
ncbi:hypothetical protein FRC10_002081, partial [Ceratobasidium sp. 414]